MGGIGKTTLAQLVYNDRRVVERFDLKAWVCVSDEFDLVRITKTILKEIDSGASEKYSDDSDLNLLQLKLKERLSKKKFFLSLMIDKVASVMRSVHIHHLGQLSFEDCWSLFAKHAFENGDSSLRPELEEIGKGFETWDLPNDEILPALSLKDGKMNEILEKLRHLSYFRSEYDQFERFETLNEVNGLRTFFPLNLGTWPRWTRIQRIECQNVVDAKDASEANLVGKQYLDELQLEWHCRSDVEQNGADIVLNNLQPHSNLKRLTIYVMVVQDFQIERVGAEFYGTEPSFVSLKLYHFRVCENGRNGRVGSQGGEFPRLKELYIERCPKLTGDLPTHLPFLTRLWIKECEQLVAPLPRVPAILQLTTRSRDIHSGRNYHHYCRALN
ncbi:putative disease resistance protein RGA3 [Vitis vinifera]|uniref:Putative disease resistance protein RGA3 n=1 Tax=Vitis vinifera TaxID=29760 RepID=A0A438J6T3_VITVI|nr:putative disease resistance protein RGA3 [Vitis vinifera]